MPRATLFNPTTNQRVPVEVGSDEAQRLFGQGFQLETVPPAAPAAQPQSYADFLNQAFQNPEYTTARENYLAAQRRLAELASQEPGFQLSEQQRLQRQDPELQKLLQEQASFRGQLNQQPFDAANQYRDIFDPTKREQLIAQSVSNVLTRLGGVGSLIENRRGTAEEQAKAALGALQSQIESARGEMTSAKDVQDTLGKRLEDIAGKNYNEQLDLKKRELDLQDYIDKLSIQRQLGIGDFKPTKVTTTKPTEAEKQMGVYAQLRGTYKDDYLKWLADKSSVYGMSLDPNSQDVRNTFEAEQNQLTTNQQYDNDYRQSLQDAVNDYLSGNKKAMDTLLQLFPEKASNISEVFSNL